MSAGAKSFLKRIGLIILSICMLVMGFFTLSPKDFLLAKNKATFADDKVLSTSTPTVQQESVSYTAGGIGMLQAPTGQLTSSGKAHIVYFGGQPWYVLDTSYDADGVEAGNTGVLLLSRYVFSRSMQWMAFYNNSTSGEGYLSSDIRGYLSGKKSASSYTEANTYTEMRALRYYGDEPNADRSANYWIRKNIDTTTASTNPEDKDYQGPYYVKSDNITYSSAITYSKESQFTKALEGNDLYTYDGSTYTPATTWVEGTSYYCDTTAYIEVDVIEGFEQDKTYYTFTKPSASSFIKVDGAAAPLSVSRVYYYAGYRKQGLDVSDLQTGKSTAEDMLAGESTLTNNLAIDLGLTDADKAAILATTRSADSGTYYGGTLDSDTFFLLSYNEVMNSAYFSNASSRKATFIDGTSANWWTRSSSSSSQVAYFNQSGVVAKYNANAAPPGVRPAFNLNPEQVLFTSDINGGKTDLAAVASFSVLATESTKSHKLTLKDSSISIPTCDILTKNEDNTYTIKYSGGIEGEGNYVSAIIKDASGNIYGYSKLGSAVEGTAVLELPAGVDLGEQYSLYIFNEKCSDDTSGVGVDYASNLLQCNSVVTLTSIEITPNKTAYDANTLFVDSDIVVTATYSNYETMVLNTTDYEVVLPSSYIESKGFQFLGGTQQTITIKAKVNNDISDNYVVTISKAKVEKPTADETQYVYNGEEQTYNLAESDLYTISQTTYTNAGSYTITVSLVDKDNYEWTSGNSDALVYTFTIEKATYDMSGISFENGVFTYDSTAKSLTINGELPAGVTVEYSANNSQTNATTEPIEITAVFSGDSANYNAIDNKTATLTINKAYADIDVDQTPIVKVYGEVWSLPVATTNFGEVVCDTKITDLVYVDEYTVTYTVVGTDNYNGDTKTISVTIIKATYDMSAITFENKTFKYDGTEKSIEIAGELPNGVTVVYSGNGQSAVGFHTVTATFTGDSHNYNAITPMTAVITINNSQIVGGVVEGVDKPLVIMTSENGFAPYVQLLTSNIALDSAQTGNSVKEKEVLEAVFDISLVLDSTPVQPDGQITIKIYLSEKMRAKDLRLVHNHKGTFSDVEFTIEGEYAVFSVDNLSQFLFIRKAPADGPVVVIIIVVVIAVILVAAGVVTAILLTRKRKSIVGEVGVNTEKPAAKPAKDSKTTKSSTKEVKEAKTTKPTKTKATKSAETKTTSAKSTKQGSKKK